MKFVIAMMIAQVFCTLVSLALFCTGLYVAWHFKGNAKSRRQPRPPVTGAGRKLTAAGREREEGEDGNNIH